MVFPSDGTVRFIHHGVHLFTLVILHGIMDGIRPFTDGIRPFIPELCFIRIHIGAIAGITGIIHQFTAGVLHIIQVTDVAPAVISVQVEQVVPLLLWELQAPLVAAPAPQLLRDQGELAIVG